MIFQALMGAFLLNLPRKVCKGVDRMLENLSKHIQSASGVATVIISVAFMLLFGFLLTRITKRLKLPNVTAYIVAGILIGHIA